MNEKVENRPLESMNKQKRTPEEMLFSVEILRKAGLTNPQIAQELNLEIQTVKNLAHELIQAGKLEPHKRGMVSGYRKQLAEDRTQLIKLWIEGLGSDGIAQRLGKSPEAVEYHLRKILGFTKKTQIVFSDDFIPRQP